MDSYQGSSAPGGTWVCGTGPSGGGSYCRESRCCQWEKSPASLRGTTTVEFSRYTDVVTVNGDVTQKLTTHEIVQLDVGEGFDFRFVMKLWSITEKHGLQEERKKDV